VICKFAVEVTRGEQTHSVEVCVYADQKELNEATRRYYREKGSVEKMANDVRAITHSFQSFTFGADGSESLGRNVCIIRIDKSAGASILGHEVLHAACQLYRCFWGAIDLGEGCDDAEERLAYLHSDLTYEITTKLIALEVW
jgi:hypothetical protein